MVNRHEQSGIRVRHYLHLTSGSRRILRALWMYRLFVELLFFSAKVFGHRRLYSSNLTQQARVRIRTDHILFQICAFYFVRYAILSGLSQAIGLRSWRISRDVFWLFGLLRDYMTFLDYLVDTTGCSLLDAMNDVSSKELFEVFDQHVARAFPRKREALLGHIDKAAQMFRSNESAYNQFYSLEQREMEQVLETDTGAFAILLGNLFCEIYELNPTDRQAISDDCFAFSMAFTIADDFLDLREDVFQN